MPTSEVETHKENEKVGVAFFFGIVATLFAVMIMFVTYQVAYTKGEREGYCDAAMLYKPLNTLAWCEELRK